MGGGAEKGKMQRKAGGRKRGEMIYIYISYSIARVILPSSVGCVYSVGSHLNEQRTSNATTGAIESSKISLLD